MISDVFDVLCHVFKAYGCPAEMFLGQQYCAQNTGTLRVVMWQTSDTFENTVASVITPTQRIQYINPRPVLTRKCGLAVEMWATAEQKSNPADQYRADLAYLDALINMFIVAIQQIASGIHVIDSGVAAPGNASSVVAGLGYTLNAMVDIPVIDAPWPAQQLSKCSETWAYHSATAEVTISGKVDPEPPYYQPQGPFIVPTPPEDP